MDLISWEVLNMNFSPLHKRPPCENTWERAEVPGEEGLGWPVSALYSHLLCVDVVKGDHPGRSKLSQFPKLSIRTEQDRGGGMRIKVKSFLSGTPLSSDADFSEPVSSPGQW